MIHFNNHGSETGKNRSHLWSFLIVCIIYSSSINIVDGSVRLRTRNDKEGESILHTADDEDRIIGGEVVTRPRRYPYIVPILDSQNQKPWKTRIQQYCMGTLVAPDVVLSAAHCQGRQGKSPDYVQFNPFNTITKYTRNNRLIRTVKIIKQFPHPDFDPVTFSNDLMLFKLSEKCTSVKPVILSDDFDLIENEQVTVLGWGVTIESGSGSRILREVDLSYVSAEECAGENYDYGDIVEDNMVCAVGDMKDACFGDSGGPMILKDPTDDSEFDKQYALVSWGFGCADPLYPGVYAKVNYDWIMTSICDPDEGLSPDSCTDGVVTRE